MTGFGITRRFIAAMAAIICLCLALTAFAGAGWGLPLLCTGALLLFWLTDFLLAPGKKHFVARRETPARFEQRALARVRLVLTVGGGRMGSLRVADSPPRTFRGGRESRVCPVEDGCAVLEYEITATERGAFTFGKCYLELEGPWGLSCKRFSLACPGEASVYPNLDAMRHYRLLASKNQLSREDTALHRIRGNGSDFSGLKEYIPGDDWRKINWKASARAQKLISSVYEVEKNREVILAVDAGRWMQAPMGEVTRLDRALELTAAIMQVAICSGDRVGLAVYDVDVAYYLPPGKGTVHTSRFLQALYSVKPQPAQSSFSALSGLLCHKLTKRAFICVLTYLDNPAEAAQALGELAPLRRRHSLCLASLSDVGLESLIDKKATDPGDIYLKASAAYRRTAVHAATDVLRKNGIGAYSAEPGELLTRSVRHYLSLRRMGG